ncbi:MAG: hypothetical protein KDF65_10105 [Anaerolineae bacterium]|nr:hypothetical protein [Anaerolineae bacterium]
MSQPKLKLVKSRANQAKRGQKSKAQKNVPASPLSPAEEREAARFRALVSARAAQKFMVHQILHALEEPNDISSAA